MASPDSDRGHCLRYKSDLQKKALLSSALKVPLVEQRHGSLFMWCFISLFLLLLFIVYRRQQEEKSEEDETTEEQQQQQQQQQENSELNDEQSEYRLSAARALPTITEENATTLTPSNSHGNFIPLSVASPPLARDINDGRHSSSSLRQRRAEKTDREELDGFVQIPPLNEVERAPQPHLRPETTTRLLNESTTIIDDDGHPVIFRKFCSPHEHAIRDDFTTLEEINQAVADVGLVRSQLIFGIDYTISNLETGKDSFNGLPLHHIEDGMQNPYQRVITIVGRTLEKFDSDSLIPAFGFGDRTTLDRKIFPLRPDGSYCRGFRGVLEAYNKITPRVRMSGPTNFAPLIKEAIRIVKKTAQYHILVIVADGQVTNERQTKEAIVEASHYPLSIVMVGVGDGPWDMMNEFDDSLPTRQFDNFQFVNYNSIVQASFDTDADFALNALMEIPSQYAAIKKLGLLKDA